MIEAPRVPSAAAIVPPIPQSVRRYRPQVQVFKGALPEVLTPGEDHPAPERPMLWIPVIPAERKRAMIELHRTVAETWTQGLRGTLRPGDQIKLSGFTFESFERLAGEQMGGAMASLFAVEGTRMAGCVLVSARLAACFARCDVEGAPGEAGSTTRLTRLETAMARRAIDSLVSQLGDCYARAGISPLKGTGRGEELKDTPLFGQQDYLAIFRYGIGAAELGLSLTVAVNVELAGACRAEPVAMRAARGSARVGRLAAAVPVEAQIVLGSWTVPLAELAALAPGDEVVLPAGDDARLEVAGIEVRALRVEVTGATLRAHLRGPADAAA
jgi:hypothetical protein